MNPKYCFEAITEAASNSFRFRDVLLANYAARCAAEVLAKALIGAGLAPHTALEIEKSSQGRIKL